MSILVRFAPPSMTVAQYEQVKSAVEENGGFPPDGLEFHCCFGSEGQLRVSEIWASHEQFEAFGERLMPAIQEAGIDMSSGAEIHDVHNMVLGATAGQAA
jgi:hypothetical protein